MSPYLTKCTVCRNTTSVKYARDHSGKCKACATATEAGPVVIVSRGTRPTRNERILEHGYQAYAREEGQDGNGDCPW